MEGNNNPKFCKGQRVVALQDAYAKIEGVRVKVISKDEEFRIKDIWFCCTWRVDVGLLHSGTAPCCDVCRMQNGNAMWAPEELFAPVDSREHSISIEKEVLDSLPKITEERSDVKPQTVNN